MAQATAAVCLHVFRLRQRRPRFTAGAGGT